jgi:cytochrome oxidase Cu insertion factor (SCO1/SenC/PrrC family)
MKKRSLLVLLPVAGLIILLVSMTPHYGAEGPLEKGGVGWRVEDFELPTYDGGIFRAGDLDGRVTLLVFWYPT